MSRDMAGMSQGQTGNVLGHIWEHQGHTWECPRVTLGTLELLSLPALSPPWDLLSLLCPFLSLPASSPPGHLLSLLCPLHGISCPCLVPSCHSFVPSRAALVPPLSFPVPPLSPPWQPLSLLCPLLSLPPLSPAGLGSMKAPRWWQTPGLSWTPP